MSQAVRALYTRHFRDVITLSGCCCSAAADDADAVPLLCDERVLM